MSAVRDVPFGTFSKSGRTQTAVPETVQSILGVGVGEGVLVAVAVGVSVGHTPGQGVGVFVGVGVGPLLITTTPLSPNAGMSLPNTSAIDGVSVKDAAPILRGVHWIVARRPPPVGPGGDEPDVTQPNRSCFWVPPRSLMTA